MRCGSARRALILPLSRDSLPLRFFQGDPTYLIVNKEGAIESYGINAICTHLGCVVPWNPVRPAPVLPWTVACLA